MQINRSQYLDALHWAFGPGYCLPPSPTGEYYRVERWRNSQYVATFATRAAAARLARDISAADRFDASVIRLNVTAA